MDCLERYGEVSTSHHVDALHRRRGGLGAGEQEYGKAVRVSDGSSSGSPFQTSRGDLLTETVFATYLPHASNCWRDPVRDFPERVPLAFQMRDEHTGFDAHLGFHIQPSNDLTDVQVVQLGELASSQPVIAVLTRSVMRSA